MVEIFHPIVKTSQSLAPPILLAEPVAETQKGDAHSPFLSRQNWGQRPRGVALKLAGGGESTCSTRGQWAHLEAADLWPGVGLPSRQVLLLLLRDHTVRTTSSNTSEWWWTCAIPGSTEFALLLSLFCGSDEPPSWRRLAQSNHLLLTKNSYPRILKQTFPLR